MAIGSHDNVGCQVRVELMVPSQQVRRKESSKRHLTHENLPVHRRSSSDFFLKKIKGIEGSAKGISRTGRS
jgi:hypothetical protein